MDKCFADIGTMCFALKRKECEFCPFYKPKAQAVKELKASPSFIAGDRDMQKLAKAWED